MRLRLASVLGMIAVLGACAAWLTTEVVMAPTSPERTRMIAMFVAIGAVTVVVGIAIQELTRRSISRRILGATLIGPLVVSASAIVGARSMFISTHDAQFIVILIALATILAVGTVSLLSRPLVNDLARLQGAVTRMEKGDLSARSDIRAGGEVGDLGRSFDAMAERIEHTSDERDRVERERTFMLASLSHDARTPLTAMRVAVEALQDGMAPDPERYLHSIEQDLRAVEGLIENIFLLGRLDAGQVEVELESIPLTDLAEMALESMEPLAASAGVSLAIDAQAEVVVEASVLEALRVLNNLVSNAIRHSPEGGTVWIVVTNDESPQIHVLDEGPGFSKEFLPDAFDQFTRADPARDRAHGGAGLGLAVARGLVEKLGGSIWAFPGPGGKVGFSLRAA